MTAPGDVTGNYVQLMTERGWTWDDLADDFERQAVGPPMPLDRGENAHRMARWARAQARAGQARTAPDAAAVRQAVLEPLDVDTTDSGLRALREQLDVLEQVDPHPITRGSTAMPNDERRELAADQRRAAADDDAQPDPRPDDAAPDAPPRKAVPPRKRQG